METHRLLELEADKTDDALVPRRREASRRRVVVGVVASVGLVAAAAAASGTCSRAARQVLLFESRRGGERSWRSNKIEVRNEYSALVGDGEDAPGEAYPSPSLGAIVEPRRETLLSLEGATRWRVSQVSNVGAEGQFFSVSSVGPTARVVFPVVGDYDVRAVSDDDVEQVLRVSCRYVRRNIRRLTAGERGRFLDAIKVLMTTTTRAGRRDYGEHFLTLDHFVATHLDRASRRDVDEMHDGMGFLTQHMALTNEFELAIQAVDPMLAVPYWDYTEDLVRVHDASGDVSMLWDDELWSPEWFGNATHSPLHTVTEGRFAYQRIGRTSSSSSNPFGYLRAPWNVNKSPFVTRVHTFCGRSYDLSLWPSCHAHHNLTFGYRAWRDYVWESAYAPHGPVHYFVGGFTHCGGDDFVDTFGQTAADVLALLGLGLPKNFWRDHIVESPLYCSSDSPQSECHLVCTSTPSTDPDFVRTVVELLDEYTVQFLGSTKGSTAVSTDWLDNLTASPNASAAFVEHLCAQSWYPGEQLEAASPADVSFWPIHPTLERLLHYKLIVAPFDDLSWDLDDTDDADYCLYSSTSDCRGHHGYDLTSFRTLVRHRHNGTFHVDYLTNGEMLEAADMADYRMPYVYDNFAWPHCQSAGVDFPDAVPLD